MLRQGFFVFLLACLCLWQWPGEGRSQTAAPPPEKIAELARIINDPDVKAWLESQQKETTPAAQPSAQTSSRAELSAIGADFRVRFRQLTAALPELPGAIVAATDRVRAEAVERGLLPPGFLIAGIVAIALVGEWLSRRYLRFSSLSPYPVVAQAANEVGPIAVFALVAAVVFLAFDWPPSFDAVMIHYLAAAVLLRIAIGLYAMAAAAGSLTPHMRRRITAFTVVLLFGFATVGIGRTFDVDPDVRRVLAVLISVVLLALSIETVLNEPLPQTWRTKALKIAGLILLWATWASGFLVIFWLLLYAAILPKLLPVVDRLGRAFAATRWPDEVAETHIPTVLVIRGLRAVLIGLAVAWLSVVWQVNPEALASSNTLLTSVFKGLLKSVIVILIADLGWAVSKAAIKRQLLSVSGDGATMGTEGARRARLRTLLPIFQNALAATLLVVTILMVLSELGVEIAPLIAGAGVVGVAIGFGSQTLVKDVISGVFYLMDDAFRVGEYIQSGSYMGTVESFSLRSVRLRHHRGPVFTVPFGALGAVQNMSRDWVIDKFRIRVGFNTDIAKAKKLTKVIGAELLQDEELGPLIIQTVKMKGVEQISDYGIELSFAFTSMPGNQSMIRRRAYAMIRKSFTENGIDFAQPTVQVGGDDRNETAAATHLAHKAKAEADAKAAQQEQP